MWASIGDRLPNGTFASHNVPERQTVRHGIALDIELGRARVHDAQQHPFKNWGYQDYLAYHLFKVKFGETVR